jgi:hypothetical protein
MALPGSQMQAEMMKPKDAINTFSSSHVEFVLDRLEQMCEIAGPDNPNTKAEFDKHASALSELQMKADTAKSALDKVRLLPAQGHDYG